MALRIRFELALVTVIGSVGVLLNVGRAQELSLVSDVELQPLAAQVVRVADALKLAGAPLTREQRAALDAALAADNDAKAIKQIQELLDPLCLVEVGINPESRVQVKAGGAPKELMEQGWRVFLVKVHNEAGVTAVLRASSPNAAPVYEAGRTDSEPPATIKPSDVAERWLSLNMFEGQPLNKKLSGLKLEYRVIELFSRDRGQARGETCVRRRPGFTRPWLSQ